MLAESVRVGNIAIHPCSATIYVALPFHMSLWIFLAAWCVAFWFARALWRFGRTRTNGVASEAWVRAKAYGALRMLATLTACGLGLVLFWVALIMVGGFASAVGALR